MEEKSIAQMKKELQEFYFKKVKNNLQDINRIRKHENINSIYMFFLIMSLVGLVIFGILKIETPALICFGLTFLVAALLALHNKNSKSKSVTIDISGELAVKRRLMNDFLKIFGDSFKWAKNPGNINTMKFFQEIRNLNIMNYFLLGNIDDTISGKYMGVNFRILEFDSSLSFQNIMGSLILAPFVIGCGYSVVLIPCVILAICSAIFNAMWLLWIVPVLILLILLKLIYTFCTYVPFRGVFVEFDMNKDFEGHTFLIENAPSSRGIKYDHSGFEDVKLEDVEFNKKYKTFSNNQVEARFVLTTAFMERFKNLQIAFKAKYIRAAFKDKKITIAIDAGKDLFSMAQMNKETNAETFVELFNEILSILALIQALKLNQKIGL